MCPTIHRDEQLNRAFGSDDHLQCGVNSLAEWFSVMQLASDLSKLEECLEPLNSDHFLEPPAQATCAKLPIWFLFVLDLLDSDTAL